MAPSEARSPQEVAEDILERMKGAKLHRNTNLLEILEYALEYAIMSGAVVPKEEEGG